MAGTGTGTGTGNGLRRLMSVKLHGGRDESFVPLRTAVINVDVGKPDRW